MNLLAKGFMLGTLLLSSSVASALVDCRSVQEEESRIELDAINWDGGENDPVINWSKVTPQNFNLYIDYLTCEENNGMNGISGESVEVTLDALQRVLKPYSYSGMPYRAAISHGKVDIIKTTYTIRAIFRWLASSAEARVFYHGAENELDEMVNTLKVPVSVIGMMADSEQPSVIPPLAYSVLNCGLEDKKHCVKVIKSELNPMFIPMMVKASLQDVSENISEVCDSEDDTVFDYCRDYGHDAIRDIKKYLKPNSKFAHLVGQRMPDTRYLPEDALVGTPIVFDYKGVTSTVMIHSSATPALIYRLTHKADHANKYSIDELTYLMRNATYWKDLLNESQYKTNKVVYTTVMSFKNVIKSISKYVKLDGKPVPVLMDYEGNAYKAMAAVAGDIVGSDYKVSMYKGIVNNVNFVYEEGKLKRLPDNEYMDTPEDFPELTVPVSNRELKRMKKWTDKDWEEFKNEE